MIGLSRSECLFYGGIIVMIIAVIAFAICTVVFKITRKKIRCMLEQEYGKLER